MNIDERVTEDGSFAFDGKSTFLDKLEGGSGSGGVGGKGTLKLRLKGKDKEKERKKKESVSARYTIACGPGLTNGMAHYRGA